MVEYLFDGHAEIAFGLQASSSEPAWTDVSERPVSASTEPRLELHFDNTDAHAESIASRIKARLASERVRVELRAVSAAELARELRAGRVQVAVVMHSPASHDPVLALRETCERLGPGAADASTILRQASGFEDPAVRARAADAAERALLSTATLVPLVRVHAYIGRRARLGRVVPGVVGVLDFERAGWMP